MIKPTVGRVVLFFATVGAAPQAAIIAAVHTDTEVNLGVFMLNGNVSGYTNVLLLQDGAAPPMSDPYCSWGEHQVTQARAQSVEDRLREFGSSVSHSLAAWEKQIEEHAVSVQDTFDGLHARLDALESSSGVLVESVPAPVAAVIVAAQSAIAAATAQTNTDGGTTVVERVLDAVQAAPIVGDPFHVISATSSVCAAVEHAIGLPLTKDEVLAIQSAVAS